jgi:hypothetical protein
MTEVLRYALIGKQDIRTGTGTFEVTLGDGRVVILTEVDLRDMLRVVYVAPPTGLLTSPAGTSYVEIASGLRQQVDFSRRNSPLCRVVVTGFGTETGSTKGVAITNAAGTTIAEVTWDGATEDTRVGSWTAFTITADTLTRIAAKGSASTESLVLVSVVLEMIYTQA